MRALFAIAHKLGRAVFRVLTKRETFRDLGAGYLDAVNKPRVVRHLLERLIALGYDQASILSALPLAKQSPEIPPT